MELLDENEMEKFVEGICGVVERAAKVQLLRSSRAQLLSDDVPCESCGTCKYWWETNRVGECHRYPPVGNGWPIAISTHWCGEYVLGDSGENE